MHILSLPHAFCDTLFLNSFKSVGIVNLDLHTLALVEGRQSLEFSIVQTATKGAKIQTSLTIKIFDEVRSNTLPGK